MGGLSSDQRGAGAAFGLIGLACTIALSAILRWSLWWPHSDMRQNVASLVSVLVAVLGLAAFVGAFKNLEDKEQMVLSAAIALAASFGAIAGFELLRAATLSAR